MRAKVCIQVSQVSPTRPVSQVSPTRPRYQNTIMSPHAPGIRTSSCPHTPQASEHHHAPTRPRHQNTIMSPHAPGIKTSSCPHTPRHQIIIMSPHAPGIRTSSCPHTPQALEHHHVPTRPERAEAPSPGHRPGLLRSQTCRPVRAKALKY